MPKLVKPKDVEVREDLAKSVETGTARDSLVEHTVSRTQAPPKTKPKESKPKK